MVVVVMLKEFGEITDLVSMGYAECYVFFCVCGNQSSFCLGLIG